MLAAMSLPAGQRGETLIGLMVGLALGFVVLAAGTQMLSHQLRGQRWLLQDSHAQHDLRAALDAMTGSLRQAQSLGEAWRQRTQAACTDAFCDAPDDFSISADRIEFSVDRNRDGTQDNNECLGFRLVKGELKARTACQPEVWTSLTDAGSLQITGLQWRVQCAAEGRLWHRWVTVTLTAHWPGDTARQWEVSQTVGLRNALPSPQAPAYC
jgi:type II secretory pathway component PulJ